MSVRASPPLGGVGGLPLHAEVYLAILDIDDGLAVGQRHTYILQVGKELQVALGSVVGAWLGLDGGSAVAKEQIADFARYFCRHNIIKIYDYKDTKQNVVFVSRNE